MKQLARNFFFICLVALNAFSFDFIDKPLESIDPFKVEFLKNQNSLFIKIKLEKDIYLYNDKLKLFLKNQKLIDITNELNMPKPVLYNKLKVHFNELDLILPFDFLKTKINSDLNELELHLQACSKQGLCYAPEVIKKNINFDKTKEIFEFTKIEDFNETELIAKNFSDYSFIFTIITFFGFGFLLSLTPCVFPMIPILSSIIVKNSYKEKFSTRYSFFLSLIYVFCMSLTYAIIGIFVASFGSNLQVELQNPYVISFFSIMFLFLAISMFGYFEIKIPLKFQEKFNKPNQSKGYLSISLMGMLSALIVGPCVAPPLAGALIYIAQTGDYLLGGLALFFMGLGMGVPLLLIGLGLGKFMPKSGQWMVVVSKIFGFVMLGLSIYFISKVIDSLIIMYLWSFLALTFAIFIKDYSHILLKLISIICFIYGSLLFVGAISKATNPFNPLEKFIVKYEKQDNLNFKNISNFDELNFELKSSSKPVMLYFWATWCVSCTEFKEITFKDEKVKNVLSGFTLLKVDVSSNTYNDKALQKKFQIVGPPAIIFWDENKKELKNLKIVGYKNPKDFLEIINKIY